jgi:hypothetical protein
MMHVEFCSYDGVDLKLRAARIRKHAQQVLPVMADGNAGELASPDNFTLEDVLRLVKPHESAVGVQKILQTDCEAGMLLKIRGEYCVIQASFLPVLQCLERNTAECIMEALERIRLSGEYAEQFAVKLFVVAADGATYNSKAFREMCRKKKKVC